tara:strand:- start:141 stop:749 length:609 start_codon:yes stop_codon:yes gene_type:complete
MVINATHIHGNLGNPKLAENLSKELAGALKYLRQLGVPFILYSGLNELQDEELDFAISQLNIFANRCAEKEVTLLFHNHYWEFENNKRIWNRLLEKRSPSLCYALDLGWVVKSGQDLSEILNELGEKIKIIHFKDFFSKEAGLNTCHLGEGIIDFSKAWEWIKFQNMSNIWLTAEQENADDPDIACRVNGSYLLKKIKMFGL